MPRITEQELKRQLESGQLSTLYVLAGEEKYIVRRAARQLIDRAAGDAFPEFNRNELDGSCPIDRLADAAEALPFMAEHKCVAVQDLDFLERDGTEADKLYELLGNLPWSTTLVLWFPTWAPGKKYAAKWSAFLKKAESWGQVLLCPRRTQEELGRLLAAAAKKEGCAFPANSRRRLVEYAGQDLARLLGETEKLCAYALGTGQAEITTGMVEKLVPKSTEITVFLMVDALTAGNFQRAYGLLEELFRQQEKPTSILAALSSAYVDMYRVQAALDSGLPASAPMGYADYKGKSFRLERAQRSGRKLGGPALCQCLSLLLEADLALKGSRLQERVVLDGLIAQLLLATTQGADR